jgi:hypothetical protein
MFTRNLAPEPSPEERARIREWIPRAGIEPKWAEIVQPAYREAMPFDEPVLGLIGMWTLGGGPNPHSALALGHIMEEVGQHEIAWNCYERAVELGDGFSPDSAVRETLIGVCQAHQHAIARTESPGDPQGWERGMRTRHTAEMAFGRKYQQDYQAYEEKNIRDGFDPKERNFYFRFFNGRPNIASNPGLADDLVVTSVKPRSLLDFVPMVLLGIGVTMLLDGSAALNGIA